MKWYQSLKTQIAAALLLQVVLVTAMAVFSQYALSLRKHDYAILNLVGQLRVISQSLLSQGVNYKQAAPRDYESYSRDLNLYYKNLKKHLDDYTIIIDAFEARLLPADLTGNSEPIYCNWDEPSVRQLNSTAGKWRMFKAGLLTALGGDAEQPRLEAAAEYIIDSGAVLQQSSGDIASAFQHMMEIKLDNISFMNRLSVVVFISINMLILLGFVYRVFRPLDYTRQSFRNVANGDLSYQVKIESKNEIGSLAQSFNSLTQRLAALFRLSDRIHQAHTLDESVKLFYQEFKQFLPLDWVGLIRCVPGTDQFILERMYTDMQSELYENEHFGTDEIILQRVAHINCPVNIGKLHDECKSSMAKKFSNSQLLSLLALPLDCQSDDTVILLLASRKEDAYEEKHLELLKNISTQLSHSLDKTIGMEGLVISTIEGLAKLAESRDPETGDHLTRMSLYSAVIAEKLSENPTYRKVVSAAYIRDVFRFAPMHDIGKVGIEDSILLKPGKLSAEERREMEKHPLIGARVLERCEQQVNALGHSVFKTGIEIAGAHHEKFDGSGYPNKRSGNAIPLSARIVAAADVFDALTSKRPYKEAWPIEKALVVMKEESGKHFDPDVIDALFSVMPKIMDIYNEHKHI